MRRCGPGFAPVPRIIRGGGFDPPITTPAPKAGQSIRRRFNALARRRAASAAASAPKTPRHLDRALTVIADVPNRVWAVDFQFDSTTDGRPVKIVSIMTSTPANAWVEWSNAASPASTSWPTSTVWPLSAALIWRCCAVTTDPNWPAAQWSTGLTARLVYFIPPGEPWRNGDVESFNSRIRDDHGGVVGTNDNPAPSGNGGWFESEQGEGVRGWSKNPNHAGVVGVNSGGADAGWGLRRTRRCVA
jgi:putative transposase